MAKDNESSSRGDEALRLQVTKNIRALLISAPHGLTVAEIQKDYNTWMGRPLPFREMGYKTPLDLLKDLPNVTRPTWENGVLVLRGRRFISTSLIVHNWSYQLERRLLFCMFQWTVKAVHTIRFSSLFYVMTIQASCFGKIKSFRQECSSKYHLPWANIRN